MTERKPPGVRFETWVDRQLRIGRERGAFDDLPGTGKPLDLPPGHDELWWVKDKLRREGVEYLPESLRLRRELAQAKQQVIDQPDEAAVAALVDDINARVARANATAQDGPQVPYFPLDLDVALARWRAAQAEQSPEPVESGDDSPAERPAAASPSARWRARMLRRFAR